MEVNLKLSVAIPTYEMNGKGVEALGFSFNILKKQTLKDFEVVISDHSKYDDIKDLCRYYNEEHLLDVRYYRSDYKVGNGYANMNVAIKACEGEYIKLLCQDDFLYDKDSLEVSYNDLKKSGKFWSAHMYVHSYDRVNFFRNHLPSLNPNIELVNTIGAPSCITIKNENLLEFDEELIYRVDCEWYRRLWNTYGVPYIGFTPTHVNYLHKDQVSNSISKELEEKEIEYIKRKHYNG
jgi:glycosyltransferase involved in cell wall biosynthesis